MMQTPNELLPDGLQMDLLWTNASPTSSFSGQNISLDLSKCQMIFVLFAHRTDDLTNVDNVLLLNMVGNKKTAMRYYAYDITYQRNVSIIESGVKFENEHSNGLSGVVENYTMIPTHIYGIR